MIPPGKAARIRVGTARLWLAASCGVLTLAAGRPAIGQQRVTLPPALRDALHTSANPSSRIQITDPQGRSLTDASRAVVRDEALFLERPDARAFIVRLDQVERMRLPREVERVPLPGGLVTPIPGDPHPAWFQLTLAASPTPAIWDESRGRYTTRLWLGLRASDHAPPTLMPETPVAVRLGYVGLAADAVEIAPLDRAGLEHEREVELHFLPTTPSPTLQVRSNLASVDFDLEAPPRVELRPFRLELPGFGLGTANVTVTHLLPHGVPAPAPSDMPIFLTVEGGAVLEPDAVVIRQGESQARFAVRSSGLGDVRILAHAGVSNASATVNQTLPLLPWIAALLGGLLGGFARGFRPQAETRGTRRRLMEGLVVAAIAYVATVLGVAFWGVPAPVAATEAGALLTGAMAGFTGVVLLERLTSLPGGGSPAPPS